MDSTDCHTRHINRILRPPLKNTPIRRRPVLRWGFFTALNIHIMAYGHITHIPGAGGNFMMRLLHQAHTAHHLIPELAYPPRVLTGPLRRNWIIDFEWQWESNLYWHTHTDQPAWLRITVTTEQEWQWALANALWKNSPLDAFNSQASDPSLPSDHQIPLSSLWQWPRLAQELSRIQTAPVNPHQHELWQQWKLTWCPHTHSKRWQRLCDTKWGHLRPAYIQSNPNATR